MDEVDVGCLIANVHCHSDRIVHWIAAPCGAETEMVSAEGFLLEGN